MVTVAGPLVEEPRRPTRTGPVRRTASSRPPRWSWTTSRSRCVGRTRSGVAGEARRQPRKHSQAGVLWLHWLGEINDDRTEYLAEAADWPGGASSRCCRRATSRGCRTRTGRPPTSPWCATRWPPCGRALDRLGAERIRRPSRIALVGHDYGAMYGALVADPTTGSPRWCCRLPTRWATGSHQFWLGLEGAERDAYLALFDGLDPVDHTARLGSRVLFQWAGQDDLRRAGRPRRVRRA